MIKRKIAQHKSIADTAVSRLGSLTKKAQSKADKMFDNAKELYGELELKGRRLDTWWNASTGLGEEGYDPTVGTRFIARVRIPVTRLDTLYTQNALAQRIMHRPAWDATRQGWITHFEKDKEEKLNQEVAAKHEELGTKFQLEMAMTWARLYGSAFLFPVILEEGKTNADPLTKESKVTKFLGYQIYDRWQTTILELNRNIDSENFGKPERYLFQSLSTGKATEVHYTRVFRFDGLRGSERQEILNEGFGFSVMEQVFQELRSYGSSFQYTESIIKEFTESVFQIANLKQLLAGQGTDQVRERFRLIKLGKSMLNAVVTGADESYEKKSSSVTGLADLLNQFQFQLSAATGIPQTFLFGRSPAGMNATGDSDVRNYYDQIRAIQERDMLEAVNGTTDLILSLLSKAQPFRTEFKSLWQTSEKEQAEIYKTTAEGDAEYVSSKVLLAEEVANSRFGGNEGDVTLDEALRIQKQTEEQNMLELMQESQLNRTPEED